ncbi:hypothetical protein FB451DRAFT_1093503 [Mycena latifolia]|nr:hypothetical protein FB451DRAFT_1093503 [Mycena latifolia]
MNAQHHAELLRKVRATPMRYIQSARQQSPPGLSALLDMSSVWPHVPQMMELGIVDMLLAHLRADKAPMLTRRWQLDADFAHLALFALAGMEPFFDLPQYDSQARAVLDAWPGIFKWCAYIYEVRVASASAQKRRIFLDTLVKVLYVLSRFNKFANPMIGTPECLELLTKLWMLEEIPAGVESIILGPIPTTTLALVLKCAALLGHDDIYDRVVRAAGGDSDFVVQLVLGRVKKATKVLNPNLGALGLSWHVDLITELFAPAAHPLRRAFFDADVIPTVTAAFVALSRVIVRTRTPDCVTLLVACISFFARYLEGDDYLALVHAVKAGLLPALLDCSSALPHLPPGNVEIAVDIVGRVLPRYLVYRSFIEASHAALEQVRRSPQHAAILAQPQVQALWTPFLALLAERLPFLEHLRQVKREGTPVRCDYIKCRIVDVKQNFKQCGACQAVYYCSPECQRLAWKSAHKAACAHIRAERDRHRDKGRPKTDMEFTHHLATEDAYARAADLHALADRLFPGTPRPELMLRSDYTQVPPVYSVVRRAADVVGHPTVTWDAEGRAEMAARFEPMLNKLRQDGEAVVVQSFISSGATAEVLLTPMDRTGFWDALEGESESDKEEWATESESEDSDREESQGRVAATLDDLD